MVKRKYSKRRTSKRKYFKSGGQSCKNITVCDNGDGSYTVSSKSSMKRQDASSNLLNTFSNPMGSDNTQNTLTLPPLPPRPSSKQSSSLGSSNSPSMKSPQSSNNPPDSSTPHGFANLAKQAVAQVAQDAVTEAGNKAYKKNRDAMIKNYGKERTEQLEKYGKLLSQAKGGTRKRRGSSRRLRRRQKSNRRHRRKQKKTRRRY